VIGVDKCGTSALAKFLTQHSKINFIGETYFFNRDFTKGKEYYKSLGKGIPQDELLFEKSPTYYKSLLVPRRIQTILGKDAKIVLVVCNNVRRLLSR